jgi:hypothetical protein
MWRTEPAPPAGRHAIQNLRRDLGTLEFDADIAGVTRRLWLRTSEPALPRADAVLPAMVLPAMTTGGTLRVPARVSPRLARGVEEIQSIFMHWSQSWHLLPELHRVELVPDAVAIGDVPGDRVAAFFSGGVDSFATVLARPEVTDLIFVAGLDIPLGDSGRIALVEDHLRAAARDLRKGFIRVDTNLRQLTDELVDWQVAYGPVLATVALALAGAIARVHVASFSDYAHMTPNGSHPLIDHLWASEGLEIVHDGARFDRAERITQIVDHPVVRRSLRVCWQNASELNCGVCHKCLSTMVPLAALGVLDAMETFPALELDRVAALEIADPVLDPFWHSNLALARQQGAPRELIGAIESVIASIHRREGRRPARWRR